MYTQSYSAIHLFFNYSDFFDDNDDDDDDDVKARFQFNGKWSYVYVSTRALQDIKRINKISFSIENVSPSV